MTQYSVEGTDVSELVEEIRTWQTLTVVWRTSRSELVNTLRPALDGTGKYDIPVRIDGGFNVEDLSGGRASVTLSVDSSRSDVRPIETWYIDDYVEEPVDKDGKTWDVEVVLVPDKEKAFDNSYSTSPGQSKTATNREWLFEFQVGDIATRRVTTESEQTPEGEIQSAQIMLVATPQEVRTLEESASKLGAVNYRQVPDGEDLVEDARSDNSNTVTITPSTQGPNTIPSGDYVVREWETVWNRGAYVVTMVVNKL